MVSAGIYSIIYLSLEATLFPGRFALFAVFPAFFIAAVSGLYIHSNWSFRGYGQRGHDTTRTVRFLSVQFAGLAMTTFMTWVVTAVFEGPAWVAILPSIFLTPLMTFYLQRRWVFTASQ